MDSDLSKTAEQPYNIAADRQKLEKQLVNSKEVDDLVSTIEVYHLETILSFGAEAAKKVSNIPDTILNSINSMQFDDSGEILGTLSEIMTKFDIDEIKDTPKPFRGLFRNRKSQLDKILEKYYKIGEEVDKIYVRLKQYEAEIKQANRKLNQVFEENLSHYHRLIRYSLAGEQGKKELEAYIIQKQKEIEKDNDIQFELLHLEQAKSLLEQKIQDLRITEMVAVQTIPIIQTVEYNNKKLIEKINTAFLVVLPVFRQALAQAILLKRQKIQADAVSALEAKKKEQIKNITEQAETAKLSLNGSIKTETLETAWRTIINGVEETRQILKNIKENKAENQAKIERIREDAESRRKV